MSFPHMTARGSAIRFAGGVLLCALLATASLSSARSAEPEFYTISDVSVDATAENAVDAREKALNQGYARAYQKLVEMLVPAGERDSVPQLSPNDISYYVLDYSVENERRSNVRYLADMTFRFKGDNVRELLRGSGTGFIEARESPVVVAPLYRTEEEALLWGDDNPWLQAWKDNLPRGGFVPIALPLGDLGDIRTLNSEQAEEGDREALVAMQAQYETPDVLVARAAVSGSNPEEEGDLDLLLTRYVDGYEEGTLTETVAREPDEPLAELLARGVERSVGRIRQLWQNQGVVQSGPLRTLEAVARPNSLQEWLNVRQRIVRAQLVDGVRPTRLSKGRVDFRISYYGDRDQLMNALSRRDLEIMPSDMGLWEVRPRSGGATGGASTPSRSGEAEESIVQ